MAFGWSKDHRLECEHPAFRRKMLSRPVCRLGPVLYKGFPWDRRVQGYFKLKHAVRKAIAKLTQKRRVFKQRFA